MQSLNDFELGRSLSVGPLYSVIEIEGSSAQGIAAGSGGGGIGGVVKLYQNHPAYTAEQSAAERDRFLRQIVSQKLLSNAGCAHWLPIIASGSDSESVWSISQRFAASLQRWVIGEIPATDQSLYAAIRAVVAGLRELEAIDGRAHGNLKPTNVLVSDLQLDLQSRIVLTDPASPSEVSETTDDLEAVGELIFQLVTHREYPGSLILPLEADAQWRRIGRHGRGWCELANDLLSADRPGSVHSHEELADRVERLEAGPRSKKPYAIAGGIVGMAAAVWLVLSLIPEPPPECEPNPSAWQRWAQSMADDPPRWFRTLTVVANQPNDIYYQAIANNIEGGDTLLQTIAAASRDDDVVLDPIQLLDDNVNGRDDVYFDPLAFEIELSPNDWCKVSTAVATIEDARIVIDRFLETQSADVAKFEELGLSNTATLLEQMIMQVDAEFGSHIDPEDIVPQQPIIDPETGEAREPQFNHEPLQRSYNMGALVELTSAVETQLFARLRSTFEALDSDITGIQQALPEGDIIATALPSMLDAFKSREVTDLKAGQSLLADANALADAVNTMYQVANRSAEDIHFDRLRAESGIYDLGNDGVTPATLVAWADAAPQFVPLPSDPRSEDANAWSATFAEIKRNNTQLAELFPDLASDLATQAATLQDEVKQLLNQPQPLVIDEDEITQQVANLQTRLTQLNQEIIVQTGDPEEWHAEVVARFANLPFEHQSTNIAYTTLLSDVETALAEITGSELKQPENMASYVAFKKREQQVREWLESIDNFATQQASTVELPADAIVNANLIETWRADREEQAIGEFIDELDWTQLQPRLPADQRNQTLATLATTSNAWTAFQRDITQTQTHLSQFAAASTSLDLAILDEEAIVGGQSTATETYQSLQSLRDQWNAAEQTQPLANAVSTIADRLDLIEQIQQATAANLQSWITQPSANANIWSDPAAARSVWNRLQSLPVDWLPPAANTNLASTFDAEKSAVDLATAAIQPLPDTTRQQTILQDIQAKARNRWLTHATSANSIDSPQSLEMLLQRQSDFNIDLEAGHLVQHPAIEFDARRFDIMQQTSSITDEAQLEPLIKQFTADLEASNLATRLSPDDQTRLDNFLRALRDLFNEDARKRFDPNELTTGPAAADWTYAGDGNFDIVPPDQLAYVDGNHTITFIRLDPPSSAGGEGPFRYVATDEVSIRLFTKLITDARAWDDVGTDGMRFLSLPDRLFGPRPWRWADGELVAAENWIENQPSANDGIHDADYYIQTPNPPTANHPMTYVTPAAALLAAQQVGCRFPTVQEWTDAQAISNNSTTNNLRDISWDQQFQYLKTLRQRLQDQGDTIIMEDFIWPDADIFIPADKVDTRETFINENAQPAINENDGNLWFTPVDTARKDGFHNLVGNVNEFVLQSAATLSNTASITTLSDSGNLLQANPDNVRIIGGSALSPPANIIPIDQPQRIRLLRNNYADRGAFADVGFRLAFTLSGDYDPPLKNRFTQVLEEHPYMTP